MTHRVTLWREDLMMLLAILLVALLAGCDWQELERIQHRAQINDRIRNACVPELDAFALCRWRADRLVCVHWMPNLDRKDEGDPHIKREAPRTVLTLQEWEEQ
jgi:hypothetical protein